MFNASFRTIEVNDSDQLWLDVLEQMQTMAAATTDITTAGIATAAAAPLFAAPLHFIVPNASLKAPLMQACRTFCLKNNQAMMPPMTMTLLGWAKQFGAVDLDDHYQERLAYWEHALSEHGGLAQLLDGQHPDYLSLAKHLMTLCDELTLYLLAQHWFEFLGRPRTKPCASGGVVQDLFDFLPEGGEAEKMEMETETEMEGSIDSDPLTMPLDQFLERMPDHIEKVLKTIYQDTSWAVGQEELQLLLSCWQADLLLDPPALRYLKALTQLGGRTGEAAMDGHDVCTNITSTNIRSSNKQHINNQDEHNSKAPVYVIRNRVWRKDEYFFWHWLSKSRPVVVIQINGLTQEQQHLDEAIQTCVERRQIKEQQHSWQHPARPTQASVRVVHTHHQEDEAYAVVFGVMEWLKKSSVAASSATAFTSSTASTTTTPHATIANAPIQIGLVALDRQLTRRVYQMLLANGIQVHDETGWVLSTAPAAFTWRNMLGFMTGQIDFLHWVNWLSHPYVLSFLDADAKHQLLADLQLMTKERSRLEGQALTAPVSWVAWLHVADVWSRTRAQSQRRAPHHDLTANDELLDTERSHLEPTIIASPSLEQSSQTHSLPLSLALTPTPHDLLQWMHEAAIFCQQPHRLAQWSEWLMIWANQMGLWSCWSLDVAGKVWCQHVQQQIQSQVEHLIDFDQFQNMMADVSERTTYHMPLEIMSEAQLAPSNLTAGNPDLDSTTQNNATPCRALQGTVSILPLGNTRLRAFDALWLMGASAAYLPAQMLDEGLMNTASRNALGMPSVQDRRQTTLMDWLDALQSVRTVVMSYTLKPEDEGARPSAWVQAWLEKSKQPPQIYTPQKRETRYAKPMDAASTVQYVMPKQISASALQTLDRCPYLFYANFCLNLRQQHQEATAGVGVDARDRGILWHEIMEGYVKKAQFYLLQHGQDQGAVGEAGAKSEANQPPDGKPAADHLSTALQRIFISQVHKVMSPNCEVQPKFWSLRGLFEQQANAATDWVLEWFGQGWRVQKIEASFSEPLQLNQDLCIPSAVSSESGSERTPTSPPLEIRHGSAESIHLFGRIDILAKRLVEGHEQWTVFDLKSNDLARIKTAIKSKSDIQLPFYCVLLHPSHSDGIHQAQYIGLSKKESPHLPAEGYGSEAELNAQSATLHAAMTQQLSMLHQGWPVAAHPAHNICETCEQKSFCRHGK